MREIRRLKTINCEWTLTLNGQPFDISDENVKIEITLPSNQKRELPFIPDGNVAKFTYMGSMIGDYILTAWLLRNDGQTALDVKCFELVERSYDENDETNDTLKFETLELGGNFETSPTEERTLDIVKAYTGLVADLHTVEKNNLVAAINEIYDELFINVDGNETTFDELRDGRTYRKVTVTYNMPLNEWKSICLPFNLNSDELTDIFGDGYKLGYYEDFSFDDEGEGHLQLANMTQTYNLEAGKPYVIRPAKHVTQIVVRDKVIYTDYEPTELVSGNYKCIISGNFVKQIIPKSDPTNHVYNFAISDGMWRQPSIDLPLKGYRVVITVLSI